MISLIKYLRTNSDLNSVFCFEIKFCHRVRVDLLVSSVEILRKLGISRTDGML